MRLPDQWAATQKQLADQKWNLPVIFITRTRTPGRATSARAGAMDYLAKPFECEKLLQSVQLPCGAN